MNQSVYRALKNLIDRVENGMVLTGRHSSNLDEMVRMTIKALKRHRHESEYAETELIHIGQSVRYAKEPHIEGAVIYPTPVDGRSRSTWEILNDIENTLYFPRHIIEQF